jgi:glycine oxidase
MAQPDVLIVGGGVIGAACARSLSLAGQSVLLVDAGVKAGAATPASAGMLAPLAETHAQDPLLSLRIRARDLYRDLVPALEDETGIDVGFWTDGIVQIAFNNAEADRLKGDIAWQRQQGFPVDWLEAAELRERCPGISSAILGAHLSPEDGALEPPTLMDALVRSAAAHGATLQPGQRVEQVVIEGDRAVGVRLASGPIDAGAVLIAAGCWSGRVGGLPRPLSVEPVRGQMASLDWPVGEPRAIVFSEEGYVLTRGGEAIAGSTMEHAGFDPSVTEEAIGKILSTAGRIYPALEQAPERRRWAGLRPATPDGAPIVGRDPQIQNLWYATGHGRNGVLLAAITAQIMGALMTGQPVEHDIIPLDPGRFWNEA